MILWDLNDINNPFSDPHYLEKSGVLMKNFILLFLLKNVDWGHSFQQIWCGGSTEHPQSMF